MQNALNSSADVGRQNDWAVSYRPSVKLGGFRSHFEASNVSRHSEELWYNETVCLLMTIYIYIYVYIYIYRFNAKSIFDQ